MTMISERLGLSLTVGLTKLLFGGCVWQIFGLLSDNVWKVGGDHTRLPYHTTLWFTLFTGIGDATGVCIGHGILTLFETYVLKHPFSGWMIFFKVAFALSFGAFLSGGAWQPVADGCIDSAYNFNLALVLVGAMCGSCFFVGITTGRAVINLPRNTWKDFTLSIACGCGSGFFVGTDARYPNNWLSPAVGQRTGQHPLDVFKAGLSVFLGFLCAQCLLVLVFRRGWLWTDEDVTENTKEVEAEASQKKGVAVRNADLENEKKKKKPNERTRLSSRDFSKISEQSLLDSA
jgi:hypothetical protein